MVAKGHSSSNTAKSSYVPKRPSRSTPTHLQTLRAEAAHSSMKRESGAGEPGSLIGGISGSSIRAKASYTSTPVSGELSEKRKRAAWRPPEVDTSRFSGGSSSRHKGTSSYKGPSDYVPLWMISSDSEDGSKQTKKKSKKKGAVASKQGSAKKSKTVVPPRSGPLSRKEFETLKKNCRVIGVNPDWKGWDHIIPGRRKAELIKAAKEAGFDRPVSDWTKGELTMLRQHRDKLDPDSPKWKKLLPRKSAAMIARAYAGRF